MVTSYTVAPPEPIAEDSVSWLQIGGDIDGVSSSDNLGWSVAMNSDATRIVTGAPSLAEGHVRVYDWDGSNWTQIGYIVGEASGDQFGYSVAMSSDGTRIAIGGNENHGNGSDSGHVRVYDRDTNEALGWKQVGGDIDGEDSVDESGYSVAMNSDGTRIAIGAPLNDGNVSNSGRGHVRVYDRDTN